MFKTSFEPDEKQTVLVVEDNPVDREAVDRLLGGHRDRYRLRHVGSLAEADESLRAGRPDVILLDLHLPDGSGVECVQALRTSAAGVPIVVMTGLDDEAAALPCIAAGAHDYLAKRTLDARGLRRVLSYAVVRARERLERERAEARFRLVVEAAPNAMIMVDASGTILLVNRRTEDLFGYTREELVGTRVDRLVPERFRGRHPHHVSEFFTSPRARAMGAGRELFGSRSDGTEVAIEIGLNPIETPEGMVVMASVIDITERKRAEAAVRQSEERFRLMVEGVTDYAILMLDESGLVASWNAGAERMQGYAESQIVGQHFARFYPPDDVVAKKPELELERASAAGRFEDEGWRVRSDGTRFWANVVITAMRDERGELEGFSHMTRDLTQRREAEERFGRLFEASPAGMVMMGASGELLLVNAQIERLFGYTRDELLGRPIEVLVPERFRAAHPVHRQAFLASPVRRAMGAGRELRGRRKDGSEFPVEIGLSPIDALEGPHVVASIIDITERQRMVDDLRRSNADLEQFAYVASHDLQEPLRMVVNYTELLAESYQGKLDPKADRYISYASDGARRMQRLVADLLAYARVESEGKPLVASAADAALREVLVALHTAIEQSGATVDVGPLPRVLADDTQLRQVFQNLIANALKFRGEAPPHVRVYASVSDDWCTFTVADNGIGIEPQYAERVFQMFQRLHERQHYEGSGIGLSLCRRIVERHGGRIWFEATSEGGTAFHFTVKRAPLIEASE